MFCCSAEMRNTESQSTQLRAFYWHFNNTQIRLKILIFRHGLSLFFSLILCSVVRLLCYITKKNFSQSFAFFLFGHNFIQFFFSNSFSLPHSCTRLQAFLFDCLLPLFNAFYLQRDFTMLQQKKFHLHFYFLLHFFSLDASPFPERYPANTHNGFVALKNQRPNRRAKIAAKAKI